MKGFGKAGAESVRGVVVVVVIVVAAWEAGKKSQRREFSQNRVLLGVRSDRELGRKSFRRGPGEGGKEREREGVFEGVELVRCTAPCCLPAHQ